MAPLILHIDTATAMASVSLAKEGRIIQQRLNGDSMDHASWIHVAIQQMMQDSGHTVQDISAVAVVAGPGSYTGVRVGMATAKGLCYALQLPLISLNTLTVFAKHISEDVPPDHLICPMLDARRMEVFTAVYDSALHVMLGPQAMVLEENVFSPWLKDKKIVFAGSGSSKWQAMIQHPNAIFRDGFYTPQNIASLAWEAYQKKDFQDLAYSEPIYLKAFYSSQKQ